MITLGLRPSLVAGAASIGYEAPNALQRAAIPVIRRGANVVLRAASGSGVTAAWKFGLLDRLAGLESIEADRPHALVVVAAGETEITTSVARLQQAAGDDAGLSRIRAAALTRGWPSPATAHLLVATPGAITTALGAAELKLDQLHAVVLEDLATITELAGDAAIEAVMVSVPESAQRIVTVPQATPEVERFIEQHVRRAMHFPARTSHTDAQEGAALSFMVVREEAKANALARLLGRERASPPRTWVRTNARAERLRRELALRGFRVGDDGDVVIAAGVTPPDHTRIAWDVPFDAEGLARLDADALVLVRARELSHLRAIASDAGRELRAVGRERSGHDPLGTFRATIRRALEEEDLALHLAALEPLFEERSAEEVAAALSALLRRRPAPAPAAEATTPAPPTWARLFISSGQRDGIRASDLVGAITGEARIAGDRVGRVEIRDNFSVVEVHADTAERVIRALNGTTMKGRALRVDYDRRTRMQRRRPPHAGAK